MKFHSTHAEPPSPVSLQFLDCDAGWIRLIVAAGSQSVKIHASHLFDPFPDLLNWMHAILTGVEQCAFTINEEGQHKQLWANQQWDDSIWFFITDPDAKPEPTVFIRAVVNQRQLIKTLYTGIQAYSQSQAYVPIQWEYDGLGDYVHHLAPEWDPSRLTRSLEALNRVNLRNTLLNLDPEYGDESPEAQAAEFRTAIDRLLNPDKPENSDRLSQEYTGWDIPEDYDQWPTDRRIAYVQQCLREPVSPYRGCKLRQWHSPTIQKYLDEIVMN